MAGKVLKQWLSGLGTKSLYIEPGSPWEYGYCESFNGKLRDECLDGEIFYSLKEARTVIESWGVHYNYQATALRAGLSTAGAADNLPTAQPGDRHELTSHSAW